MRKHVTILTAMLCLLFIFGLNAKAETYGDFEYKVEHGTVTITRYTGSETEVTIPSEIDGKKVTVIGTYSSHISDEIGAFSHNSSLMSVTIPSSIKTIGKFAFDGCTNLKSITIPSSVTTIRDYAFKYCTSLTSVTVPDSVTTMEYGVFADCTSLVSCTIPNSVIDLMGTFEGCSSLQNVTIPSGLYGIGPSLFNHCSSLKNVSIPSNVLSIDPFSFTGCTSLTSINIPDGVLSIGERAFDGCESLKSVTIPKSVTEIQTYAFGYVYYSPEEYHVKIPNFVIRGYAGSEAERYAKDNGFEFVSLDSNHTTPTTVPAAAPAPANVPAIPAGNNTAVGSTKTVGKNKYVVASSSTVSYKAPVSRKITSIKIPKSVKINGRTYQVTAIGNKAFSGCRKLKKVTINSPIKKIGKYAFNNCKKLSTIRIYSKKLTKKNVLTAAFKGISRKAVFYLPKSKKAAYKKILLKRGAKKTMSFKTN